MNTIQPLKLGTHIEGWQDMFELLIATWIVFSPFALGFWNIPAASLTTLAVGSLAILVSQLGLARQQPWAEWINLALAVTLMASPWLFAYTTATVATWCALVSGGLCHRRHECGIYRNASNARFKLNRL